MDPIAHTKKLYERLDREISLFLTTLYEIAQNPGAVPHLKPKAIDELGQMLSTAKEIGGKLLQDVERLKQDLSHLETSANLHKIQQDAMRIKHEVRPL